MKIWLWIYYGPLNQESLTLGVDLIWCYLSKLGDQILTLIWNCYCALMPSKCWNRCTVCTFNIYYSEMRHNSWSIRMHYWLFGMKLLTLHFLVKVINRLSAFNTYPVTPSAGQSSNDSYLVWRRYQWYQWSGHPFCLCVGSFRGVGKILSQALESSESSSEPLLNFIMCISAQITTLRMYSYG